MDFKQMKEHAGLAAMTIIIGWSGMQLRSLNETASKVGEELVSMKKQQEFTVYRVDQHRDRIQEHDRQISENRVDIGKLKTKVFQTSN